MSDLIDYLRDKLERADNVGVRPPPPDKRWLEMDATVKLRCWWHRYGPWDATKVFSLPATVSKTCYRCGREKQGTLS